jgi:hypothetical protein
MDYQDPPGATTFKKQLYQCMLAQALVMKTEVERRKVRCTCRTAPPLVVGFITFLRARSATIFGASTSEAIMWCTLGPEHVGAAGLAGLRRVGDRRVS